jgi:hypothetical protein
MARPRGDDHYRPNWLHHMVVARFDGVDPDRRDLIVEMRCGDEPAVTLISSAGAVRLVPGGAQRPDVTLAGPPEPVVGILLGRIDRAEAEKRGVSATGDVRRLRGLRPRGEAPVSAVLAASHERHRGA